MGVGARVGVGVPARGGGCCCCAFGTGVEPRGGGGVRGDGVEAVVFTDAEGGGRGERVRRVIGTVKVGEEDEESESESEDVEGWLADESVRGRGGGVSVPMPVPVLVPEGSGEGTVGVDALRWMRAGRSAGVERGVLRPERVDSSGVLAGDEKSMLPRTESGGVGVLRADRRGMSVSLEEGSDVFGAGARIGTCGGTFSRGFGTRSASRMKRKSRPNSWRSYLRISNQALVRRPGTDLAALVVCDTESLVDNALVYICAKYLYPEHLRKSFDLALCPFGETYQTVRPRRGPKWSHSLLATSFSLNVARNQSAVCLITVKMVVERSLI